MKSLWKLTLFLCITLIPVGALAQENVSVFATGLNFPRGLKFGPDGNLYVAEAGFFADCIVLLNEGRIVQSGTLDDLRTRPATEFVREFLRAQRAVEAI